MLRAAVIGMGPIGNRHAKIYREDDLAELVGQLFGELRIVVGMHDDRPAPFGHVEPGLHGIGRDVEDAAAAPFQLAGPIEP